VINGLDRLRHHTVVGRNHKDDNVRDLGAARAHGRKSFVAWRVDECDVITVGRDHLIRADVLGDTAGLAGDNVRLPDGIEQRRLAVVDVTHDRDDGRTRLLRTLIVHLSDKAGLDVGLRNAFWRVAELLHDEFGGIYVEHIVYFMHLAFLHQELDDVDGAFGHPIGELLNGYDFWDHDLARDLLTHLRDSHRLEFFALTFAF